MKSHSNSNDSSQKYSWYERWARNRYSSLVHIFIFTAFSATAFTILLHRITELAHDTEDANVAIVLKANQNSNQLAQGAAPSHRVVTTGEETEIIVGFASGVSNTKRSDVAQMMQLTKKRDITVLNASVYSVAADDTVPEVVDRMRYLGNTEVVFVEPNALVAPEFIPNDPLYSTEWYLPKIGVETAWDSTQGEGVTVAIIDTGVDCTHPELAPNCLAGFNISSNSSDATDVFGHGTKVAGVVAALGNNALGVAGAAYGAKVLPIRITNDTQGLANYADIANGIIYAADHGAKIANVSYAAYDSQAVAAAAAYLVSKGGVLTMAAGNAGTAAAAKNDPNIIVVSATDMADVRTSWSSYGSMVDVAAPGLSLSTTAPGTGYISMSGTSFGAPLTAAVLALVWSSKPTLTNLQLTNTLLGTALDKGVAGYDDEYGFGRIDVQKALLLAASGTVPAISYPGGVVNQQLQVTSYGVVSKTRDTGVVAWATNLPATGRVRYGLSTSALTLQADVAALTLTQQITITGLEPRKKYYYQIEATTASGTIAKSPVAEFSTKRQ